MFPSTLAVPLLLQNFMVVVASMLVLFVTSNPLALGGLFFCQQIQLVQPSEPDDLEERDSAIGFTANIE